MAESNMAGGTRELHRSASAAVEPEDEGDLQ